MQVSERIRERAGSLTYPLFLFVVNLFITWRLLRSEYIDQLPSIEGSFISLARYIQQHWPAYDWFPLWYGGFPFTRAYQPALHYTVAVLAASAGLSSASAYHFVTAITYSLAAVGFYWLAKTLGATRGAAFGGAFVFSVFSPSLLLLSAVRADAGGLWHARRLQAMVQYGEGPNITGLMLGSFALAFLFQAIRNRKRRTALAASLAIAAVPATNWPATVALCFGIVMLLLALKGCELRTSLPRILLIGLLALSSALPFALPSTIWSTFHNANVMTDAPTSGPARWVLLAAMAVSIALLRWGLLRMRASVGLRFAALLTTALLFVVLGTDRLHVNLVPQPMRFHVALELPMVLTGVFLVQGFLKRQPRWKAAAGVMVLIFCAIQTYHFRQHSRTMARPLQVHESVEYQEARWLDTHLNGARVAVPGTVSFWMNSFTEVPQFAGCCEQSVVNRQNFVANYIVGAGFRTEEESADYSLLWLKAWAVQAAAIGGPASREAYKAFQFPRRFHGRLPLLWSAGDDYIYRVPERATGLARIVRASDVVRHAPANGIDVGELRPFVAALEDPALPLASFAWKGTNEAIIHGLLQPGEVVSVAINYHSGWTAFAGGQPAEVHSDGLGLIFLSPHCEGNCTIEMHWSAGAEPWLAVSISALALAGALLWCGRERLSQGL